MHPLDEQALERVYSGERPWKTLLALYRPRAGTLEIAAFWYVFKSSPVWLLPLIVATIIDALPKPREAAFRVMFWSAVVGILALLQNVVTHTLYIKNVSQAARAVEALLRMALCRRLQQLSISFYRFQSAGRLQSKVLRDVENVDMMARQLIELTMSAAVLLTATLLVTALRAPWFIPFYLLTVPTVVFIRRLMQERLRFANRQFRHQVEKMSASVAGMIEMVPITRAHAAEPEELTKVRGSIDQLKSSGYHVDSQNAVFGSAAWVLFNGMYLVGVLIAAGAKVLGLVSLTPGEIVMLSGFFNTISGTVMSIANAMPMLARGFESVRSLHLGEPAHGRRPQAPPNPLRPEHPRLPGIRPQSVRNRRCGARKSRRRWQEVFRRLGREIKHGGNTALIQFLVSIFGAGFALERFFNLRRSKIAPTGMAVRANQLWQQGKMEELEQLEKTQPSTLVRAIPSLPGIVTRRCSKSPPWSASWYRERCRSRIGSRIRSVWSLRWSRSWGCSEAYARPIATNFISD